MRRRKGFRGGIVLIAVLLSQVVHPIARAEPAIVGKIFEEYTQNKTLGFNYGLATAVEANAARGGKFQTFNQRCQYLLASGCFWWSC
ncbi:MAG: hypothetical protein ACRCSF_11255 [Mycobacteriaceae bacterium]